MHYIVEYNLSSFSNLEMQLKHSEGLKKLNPKYFIIKSQINTQHC